jgi:hypothetical protein
MEAFANMFGPRDTGKTTFTHQLALELAKKHGDDAPPFDVVTVNLQRVVSLPGFIGCVHDAMVGHPVKRLRRAAQRQIGVLEKQIGFDNLDFQFAATGKPADEEALEHLLDLTRSHPRGTQQLAWEAWTDTPAAGPVTLDAVTRAHDRLVQSIERSEFASVVNVLVNGDDGEVNEVRALQLLADRGGDTITSRPLARLYGFSSHSRVRPALVRLQGRGLVDERDGRWYIVDPLFDEWLRRSSPLADRPVIEAPADE